MLLYFCHCRWCRVGGAWRCCGACSEETSSTSGTTQRRWNRARLALHVTSSMTASLPSLLPPGHVHLIVVCCVYCVCVLCVVCCVCVVCVCACVCACVVCCVYCVCVCCVLCVYCVCCVLCVVCVPVCVLYGMNVCGERGGGVWKE